MEYDGQLLVIFVRNSLHTNSLHARHGSFSDFSVYTVFSVKAELMFMIMFLRRSERRIGLPVPQESTSAARLSLPAVRLSTVGVPTSTFTLL